MLNGASSLENYVAVSQKFQHKQLYDPGILFLHMQPRGIKARKSNKSKEIKPVNPIRNQPWIFFGRTDAEAPILWPLDAKSNSFEKTLVLGKNENRRRRGQQRMKRLDSITNSMAMNLSKLREIVKDQEAWRAAVHGVPKSWTRLSNWKTTTTQEELKAVVHTNTHIWSIVPVAPK